MQKKLFRILSVFLAVVIISVCFMQPIAYANAAVIGGGALVLLVAGLLITCGMVFANQEQAEAVATHTISQLPSDLLETLTGFIGGGDPNDNNSKYSLSKLNLTTVVTLPFSVYFAFKSWYDAHFGVSEETFTGEGGSVGAINASVDNGLFDGTVQSALNVFLDMGFTPLADGSYYPKEPYTSFVYNGSYSQDVYLLVAPIGSVFNFEPLDIYSATFVRSFLNDKGYPSLQWFRNNNPNPSGTLEQGSAPSGTIATYYVAIVSGSDYNLIVRTTACFLYVDTGSFYRDGGDALHVWSFNDLSTSQVDLSISKEAWAYFHDYENDTITYALASEIDKMFDKKYSEVIGDYSLDNWDYRQDLAELQGLYDGVCAELDRLTGYDALLEQGQALQRELDRVREEVAAQGADVIGGVGALDGAMYDAGLVLKELQDMIAAQERDATIISRLERELEKAKEAISELTKTGDTDIPIDPPITEGAKGKINWNVLLNLAIFEKFPFSIPTDIYSFFDALVAAPVEPVFVFDIFGGKFGSDAVIVLHFKDFEDIRKLVRNGVFIMLVIGLIAVTKKYIWK